MGKIFYIMGKSASGKDKIHGILLQDKELELVDLILYTTRPIRSGETDGQQYHFVDEAALDKFRAAGKVIEERTYQTIAGPWTYCTVEQSPAGLYQRERREPSSPRDEAREKAGGSALSGNVPALPRGQRGLLRGEDHRSGYYQKICK